MPERLAQLLRARLSNVSPRSRRLLDLLAVAARPLTEPELVQLSGETLLAVRGELSNLLDTQLIRIAVGPGFSVKHALVGEAVAEALLPGERAELSEAVGMTLLARGDPGVAGEAADHLAAARHPRELPARITAAEHAEGIYAVTTPLTSGNEQRC